LGLQALLHGPQFLNSELEHLLVFVVMQLEEVIYQLCTKALEPTNEREVRVME
jgi:hypothetical protein